MIKKTLFYVGVLTGTYLLLANATAGGTLMTSAAGAGSTFVKTLQGR